MERICSTVSNSKLCILGFAILTGIALSTCYGSAASNRSSARAAIPMMEAWGLGESKNIIFPFPALQASQRYARG